MPLDDNVYCLPGAGVHVERGVDLALLEQRVSLVLQPHTFGETLLRRRGFDGLQGAQFGGNLRLRVRIARDGEVFQALDIAEGEEHFPLDLPAHVLLVPVGRVGVAQEKLERQPLIQARVRKVPVEPGLGESRQIVGEHDEVVRAALVFTGVRRLDRDLHGVALEAGCARALH